MGKGSQFERDVCKRLSLWWTANERDDVFWRTSNSGGRATIRGRRGLKTHGSYGDICAVDPIGQPFLDLMTIEVKRGYPTASLHALLDRSDRSAAQIYEKWVEQAQRAATDAGTPYWAIIHKRNGRETTMTVPAELVQSLDHGRMEPPFLSANVVISGILVYMTSFQFDSFLGGIEPQDVRTLLTVEKMKKKSRPSV